MINSIADSIKCCDLLTAFVCVCVATVDELISNDCIWSTDLEFEVQIGVC